MRTKRLKDTVDRRGKDFLTDAEMHRFLEASRHGRHGARDYLVMLMTYRHGLRVSEVIDLRLRDLDLDTGRVYVRRKKGSLSTHQPLEGDEIRALRAWLRERDQRRDARSSYLRGARGRGRRCVARAGIARRVATYQLVWCAKKRTEREFL